MSQANSDFLASADSVDRPSGGKRFSGVQILLAIILTVGLLLLLNFSSRIQLDRELKVIHLGIVNENDVLLLQQKDLIAELDYVKSDAYVEFWAHDDGKMIREGEILILPQGSPLAEAPPDRSLRLVEFATSAPKPKNWELWWALFFDQPPPKLQ